MGQKAVFLDRDGTLNREVHYLSRAEDFEWLKGSIEAAKDLQQAGFALVVVTNQSGIAQGMLEPADLSAIHARMTQELAAAGVTLAGIFHCPHHPHLGRAPWVRNCDCRKPKPGMLEQAIQELDLDRGSSHMVGDSVRDLQSGLALGIPGILVRTGKGAQQEEQLSKLLSPEQEARCQVADDLAGAARLILQGQ